MSKLVLSLNGVVQGDYPLTKERMTIGRKAENDIAVDNLAVSGKHALIITILDDSFLEDLGSTNGTFVNGKVIKKHALRNGDVISIGKHEIRYVNEHATADDDEFEKTIIMRPGTASAAAALAKAIGQYVNWAKLWCGGFAELAAHGLATGAVKHFKRARCRQAARADQGLDYLG